MILFVENRANVSLLVVIKKIKKCLQIVFFNEFYFNFVCIVWYAYDNDGVKVLEYIDF